MFEVRVTNCPGTQNGHDGLMGSSVVRVPLHSQHVVLDPVADPRLIGL
jgi:hypothetical protein